MLYALCIYVDFIVLTLVSMALAISLLTYRCKKSREVFLLCIYFGVLLILELLIRDKELNGFIFTIQEQLFHLAVLPVAACYCITAVITTELALSYSGRKKQKLAAACGGFFIVWFIEQMMLRSYSTFSAWIFLVPYELLQIVLAVLCLISCSQSSEVDWKRKLRSLFVVVVVLSASIILEDALVTWNPPLREKVGQITSRNFSENALQIIEAIYAIYFLGQKLVADIIHVRRFGSEENLMQGSPYSFDKAILLYAKSIGLSDREQKVAELLICGKKNSEICDELFISTGTVKAHCHNIYQKSGVKNRDELLEAFFSFSKLKANPDLYESYEV